MLRRLSDRGRGLRSSNLAILASVVFIAMAGTSCSSPAPQPPDLCAGGKRIVSVMSANELSGCASLASVAVLTAAPLSLDGLAALRNVDGDVQIGPTTQLASLIGLDALIQVGGNLHIDHNVELSGVFLSAIREVGGDVVISANGSMHTVSMPSLRRVGGSIRLTSNFALETVSLSALTSLGGEFLLDRESEMTLVDVGPARNMVPASP